MRVPVVVGGPFAREHRDSVLAAGGHFAETAEAVAQVVEKGPAVRAR